MSQIALWEGADEPDSLKPFWRGYGGKYRIAPLYPQPKFETIVEPFAFTAGYSLRYAKHRVILVEKNEVVAEIWRYLIGVRGSEVLRIPCVDAVADLPAWVPQGARDLVGFCLNAAMVSPCKTLSAGFRQQRYLHPSWSAGWDELHRARVAEQVERIKHWQVICGDYSLSPRGRYTYFVDPPYNNAAGRKYPVRPKGTVEQIEAWYAQLGQWCQELPGQVIACENEGASWLPFERLGRMRHSINNGEGSREVVWIKEAA